MISRPAIEYPIVDQCNLRCHDCDHISPFFASQVVEVEVFRRDVEAAAKVLRVKDFNIAGGEALLHPDLIEILRIARASGMGKRLTLVTNGLLLHKADTAIFELVDRIRISLYPGVALKITRTELDRRARAHDVKLDIRYRDEFLQPFPPERINDSALVGKIYARCKTAHVWSCHPLYRGYYYKCSRAPIISMMGKGTGGDDGVPELGADGVALVGDNLEQRLRDYLGEKTPIAACDWCLGTSGRMRPHRQLSKAATGPNMPPLGDAEPGLAGPFDRLPGLARRAARIMKPPLP